MINKIKINKIKINKIKINKIKNISYIFFIFFVGYNINLSKISTQYK